LPKLTPKLSEKDQDQFFDNAIATVHVLKTRC
jgi:hypothetical protein